MTEPRKQDDLPGDSEPEVEPELIKDLDVDETQTDQVRGGQSYGGSAPTH
jgi:hypothetical protein